MRDWHKLTLLTAVILSAYVAVLFALSHKGQPIPQAMYHVHGEAR